MLDARGNISHLLIRGPRLFRNGNASSGLTALQLEITNLGAINRVLEWA